jgi:hypothetical protein
LNLPLLLFAPGALLASTFTFTVTRPAEVIAEIEMASPGSNWGAPGREAALATLTLDGRDTQHVMLYAGEERHAYSAFLGALASGAHCLRIERNDRYSASGSGLEIFAAHFREAPDGDLYRVILAHAPILFARANTVGAFTDIPLISYCERLTESGRPLLQYTMIFSNEDGGTSTRALMARWGRTTDIEYIYKAWLDPGGAVARATIQSGDHTEVEFRGQRFGDHPILIPSTDNNMVSDRGSSSIRYQIPPVLVDLTAHSREQVMDDHPIAYRVMAQELQREGKLRPFGAVDGEKISDPRNYLYFEAQVNNRQSALAALVHLRGENVWRSSHLGRADYAIANERLAVAGIKTGRFRTAVELPRGTRPDQIEEIAFECIVLPKRPEPLAGVCRLEAVSKVFLLDERYQPANNLWSSGTPVEIPTGQIYTFHR